MSCPSEFTWSVYVDSELEGEELRTAEIHLVSCRSCRSQVMALRDEIEALSNMFYERVPAHGLSESEPADARHFSWSLPMAIAVVTAALTIGGLLIELRLPGMLDLLNPKRLIGVNEMVFDAIFMLRGRWPELSDAAASVGAMAAFSALGCAVLHAVSRRVAVSSSLSLLLLVLIASPDLATALDLRADVDTHVGEGETVSETLVCTGEVVSIDGTVDGDLVVAAERFTLRGVVTGNLYVFAGEIELDGRVEGTLISIGERINLGGSVEGGTALAGDRVTITDRAEFGRDVAVFGEGVRFAGKAKRDVTFAGEWIEVRAEIARDLHVLSADRIVLLGDARVGGDVRARLMGHWAEIDQSPNAVVNGEVMVQQDSIVRDHYLARYKEVGFYVMVLVGAAAAFVFGLLIFILDPRVFSAEIPDARSFVRSMGIGFVLLLSAPVAIAVIGLTVVGIPVAVLGLFFLIASLYTSYVLVAGLVGQTFLPPSGPGIGSFAPSLLAGIVLLSVIAALPFVGPAIRILAILFGLGCLFERVRGMHALNLQRFHN